MDPYAFETRLAQCGWHLDNIANSGGLMKREHLMPRLRQKRHTSKAENRVSIYLTKQLGLLKMRHERIFEIEEPYVEPYLGWIKMLIWGGVILFGALFWEGMIGLIAPIILGR